MLKKNFMKLFEKVDDETNIVIPSTSQFEGYNTISEDIEVLEDFDDEGKKILIIQEIGRII